MMLFMGEDMLYQRAHLGLLAIGLGCPLGHRPAGGLALVDLAGRGHFKVCYTDSASVSK
jgi:hypothetical protein